MSDILPRCIEILILYGIVLDMEFPIRINKYIAENGLASRREADTLIERKQVLVNGQPAVIGQQIVATDVVTVAKSKTRKTYLAYYKGRGIITHSPASHETDIMTRLKHDYSLTHVAPVGRLDKDSEGLMILTDDGRVTGPLLNPVAQHEKEYEVTVDKPITGMFLKIMETGVDIEGYTTKLTRAVAHPRSQTIFNLTLTEGKKHQIRRMCAALGYQVQSLKRVRIMNVELGTLKPNQFRKITGTELETFLASLGIVG